MKLLFSFLLITVSLGLTAQEPENSLGLRCGGLSGLSFRHMDKSLTGFEIIAGTQEDGFRLAGLIQKFKPLSANRYGRFYMVTGIGAHSGFVRYNDYYIRRIDGNRYEREWRVVKPVIGGDFMIGVDYHLNEIPLQFGIDYKPYFQFFGDIPFRIDLWDVGFTVRYSI